MPPYFFYPALIDTGAAESCIDSELASRLRLPIVDTQTVGSVGGRLVVNVYWAQIHIPEIEHLDQRSNRRRAFVRRAATSFSAHRERPPATCNPGVRRPDRVGTHQ